MKLIFKPLAAALLLLSAHVVCAQTPAPVNTAAVYSVEELTERYPAGSIQSQEAATGVLAEITQTRSGIEARFAADQQACYPKFFTTSCLNKAKEQRRVDLLRVRPIEIEANAYIRQARVVERDRRLAEKAAENAGKPILNEAPHEEKGKVLDEPAEMSKEMQRKARADAYAKKNADYAERQQNLKQNEQAEQQKRAANIKRYEEKIRESEARQQDILKRKAEKESAASKP